MGCFGKLRHKKRAANNQAYNDATLKSNTTNGTKDGNKLVKNPSAEVPVAGTKGRGVSRTAIGGGGWSRSSGGGKGRSSGGGWSSAGGGWGMGYYGGGGGCGGGGCGGGGCGGGC
ncbi:hypothetical protein EZV62_016514 [Acer yangbiense]|uniref:Uncharacterized protein n=1 Tax=Acer yangbiense TaxID=1000413 RepID=A0A5C7HPJ3_9ROSI|nr:hypothetical protein EZV62_016514 [Acer yangbiense]